MKMNKANLPFAKNKNSYIAAFNDITHWGITFNF